MSRPRLVLFDDSVARRWRPFSLTRPAGELLFGAHTFRRRAEIALGLGCIGHVADPCLAAFDEPWSAPAVAPDALPRDRGLVLLCSRFMAAPAEIPDQNATLTAAGRVVGLRLMPGADPPTDAFFLDPDAHAPDYPTHELPGELLEQLWTLMIRNPAQIAQDLADLPPSPLPDHVHHLGGGVVSLGERVRIAPGVVLDTSDGPIRLEDDVEVLPFTYLMGPAWVGARTIIRGGYLSAVSIGPRCKVRGEVESSVILGYTNKAHNGFLGHAYLGMWVNLGAITTNSDLKNTYGAIRLWTPDGEVETGETKVGCFIGDHVKTAIGTMIGTGTVVEAGACLFDESPPSYVPPFSWGSTGQPYDLNRFLEATRVAMSRRDVQLTDAQRALLTAAWTSTRGRTPDPSG